VCIPSSNLEARPLHRSVEIINNIYQCRLVLEKDFKAADVKWSLFVSAAFSFRYESCLRPFPPSFMKNGLKDMDELVRQRAIYLIKFITYAALFL
jgi:hypothetical protein